jgi:manganese/zinc/iron transport system permease protein
MLSTFYFYLISILVVILYTILGAITTPLKSAFLIDATGHTIIFGMVIGFLISHSFNSPLLFIGAVISTILMNNLNNFLQKYLKLSYDSSIGMSFSFFFCLGVIILSIFAKHIHFDLDMLLIGNIEYSLYDAIYIFNLFFIPKIIFLLIFFISILIYILYLFYNQIVMILFDPEYALIKGVDVKYITSIILIYASLAIVSSFNVTGALVLMGIATSSFGLYWNNRSKSFFDFIRKGLIYNIIIAIIGCTCAIYFDFPIAATISFLSALIPILIFILNEIKTFIYELIFY